MPTPRAVETCDNCRDPLEDHYQVESSGQQVTACRVDGCQCGHPLEWAVLVTCEWCSTQDLIVWATTVNGKRMPLDPEPDPDGNVEVVWDRDSTSVPFAKVHGQKHGPLDPGLGWVWPYMPHWATCDQKLRTTKVR